MLREAEKLIDQKIHPQTIIEGFRIACNVAIQALNKAAVNNGDNPTLFRNDLLNIAQTTLSSKILSQDKLLFSNLAVDAILRLKGSTNLNHIQIIKSRWQIIRFLLGPRVYIGKEIWYWSTEKITDAKILIANTSMDTDKVKIFGAKFKVDSTSKLAELEKAEKLKMKNKVDKIAKFGINVFINRQLIYDYPEQLFTDAKINSIEHADFDGVERLALVTGGEVVSTFDSPDNVKLGHCESIEEIIIGEDTFLKFSGVAAGEACTIVLRGATEQVLDEAERSLHDALSVLSQTTRETKTVLGGGCSEMLMAKAVDQAAANETGKSALAIEAFSRALRQLPTILADNAGYDSSDLVTKLRSAIYNGMSTSGLDLNHGIVADMREMGIVESYKLKKAVVSSAAEAAEVLLRVDNIIRAKPRTADRNH